MHHLRYLISNHQWSFETKFTASIFFLYRDFFRLLNNDTWRISLYIYIYIYGETVDFGESDRMIKISEKEDKSDIYNGFSSDILFFIYRSLKKFFHE